MGKEIVNAYMDEILLKKWTLRVKGSCVQRLRYQHASSSVLLAGKTRRYTAWGESCDRTTLPRVAYGRI